MSDAPTRSTSASAIWKTTTREPRPAPPARGRAPTLAQDLHEGQARGSQRRHQAREEGRDHRRRQREHESPAVQLDLAPAGEPLGDVGGDASADEAHADRGNSHGEDPAEQREDQAFGQELAYHPPPAGPQSRAQRHLPLPQQAARQQHPSHVRARDEEHEQGRALEERGEGSRDAGLLMAQEDGREGAPGVRPRMAALETGRDRAQLGTGLLQADPAGQAAENPQGKGPPLGLLPLGERERHPELDAPGRVVELRRHHAHHRAGAPVQDQRAPQHVRRPAQAPPPQPVAHHDHRVPPRHGLLRPQGAADRRAHTQQAEQLRRDQGTHEALRLAPRTDQREVPLPDGREPLEAPTLPPEVQEVGHREGVAGVGGAHAGRSALLRVVLGERDQRVEVGERVGPQEQRVHEAEDGGVQSDSQAEGQHHDHGQQRFSRQESGAVPQVLQECAHFEPPATAGGVLAGS